MKDYFEEAFTYSNMRAALKRCCRGVRWKDSVTGYELHAPQNTHRMIEQIRSGKYKIAPYQHFLVHEPKTREIVATRIADRQVQMALCRAGLYQDITEHFIHDNCACQTGKGTDFALKRLKTHLLRYYRKHGKEGWVLKCDVRKFFPSTRHDVAKAAIAKRVEDARARDMVFTVIDSFGGDRGIGLGSQISQLIELSVLDDLDHFIKERLRIRYYIRYMDDFLLIHPDRAYLLRCRELIREKLENIGLELNEKTTLYPLRQGVKFLQWRFILTGTGRVVMKMDGCKMARERRRLRRLYWKEKAGLFPEGASERSLQSWAANAKRGDSYWQVIRMTRFFNQIKKGVNLYGNNSGAAAQSSA